MTHEDYKELLAAKALRALDAADARALTTHVEGCSDCKAEIVELEDAAALLASQAVPLEPSTKYESGYWQRCALKFKRGSRAIAFHLRSRSATETYSRLNGRLEISGRHLGRSAPSLPRSPSWP